MYNRDGKAFVRNRELEARNLIRHRRKESASVDFDGLRWMETGKNVLTVGRVDWPSAVIAPQ